MPTDKIKSIEDRIDKLENSIKAAFLEVEKKFDNLRHDEPLFMTIESRVQEIEDLLLLLQLEVTKIKEKTGGGIDFGPAPTISNDVTERMEKIEAALAAPAGTSGLEERIARLERMGARTAQSMDTDTGRLLEELQRRLDRLESSRPETRPFQHSQEQGLLEEVRSILNS